MRQYQQSDISKFRVTVERILKLFLIILLIILLDCVIWPAWIIGVIMPHNTFSFLRSIWKRKLRKFRPRVHVRPVRRHRHFTDWAIHLDLEV